MRGGKRKPRNPPACKVFLLFSLDTFLSDIFLNALLYFRNFLYWAGVNRTFPFSMFAQHSEMESMTSLEQVLMNHFRSFVFIRLRRFSSGTSLCSLSLIFATTPTPWVYIAFGRRKRTSVRRETHRFSIGNYRPFPVSSRRTGNREPLVWLG